MTVILHIPARYAGISILEKRLRLLDIAITQLLPLLLASLPDIPLLHALFAVIIMYPTFLPHSDINTMQS